MRKRQHPYDPPNTLGIGLRQGPRGVRFIISEVPLQGLGSVLGEDGALALWCIGLLGVWY